MMNDNQIIIKDLSDASTLRDVVQAYLEAWVGTPPCEQPSVRAAFAGLDPLELRCKDVQYEDAPLLSGDQGEQRLFEAMVNEIVKPMEAYLHLGGGQ